MSGSLDRDPEAAATELGLHLVRSNGRMLLIDLDSDLALDEFRKTWNAFWTDLIKHKIQSIFSTDYLTTISKSGLGYHVYVWVKTVLTIEEQVGYQLLFYSDHERERLALLQHMGGFRKGLESCLFETQEGFVSFLEWKAKQEREYP